MADSKVENAEALEEVCCPKEKPEKKVAEEKITLEDETQEEKETNADEKENGAAKEENGKAEDEAAEDNEKEVEGEVKACKRKSTAGDAANGVEPTTTPEKKQKIDGAQAEEKDTTEAAA